MIDMNLQDEINKCDQKIQLAIFDGNDLEKRYWQGKQSAFTEVITEKPLNKKVEHEQAKCKSDGKCDTRTHDGECSPGCYAYTPVG